MNAPSRLPPVDESELVPEGLPSALPPGERMLWQGRPGTMGIAVRVLHVRPVAVWFSALAVWAAVPAGTEGGVVAAWKASWQTLAGGTGAVLLLILLGWLAARTTTYTITNRRLVMHVGIALPVTLNLPFSMIEGGGLHVFPDGSGDLPVKLRKGTRVAYLHLWPHARPWHVSEPQPMLRALAKPAEVAAVFAEAVKASRVAEEGATPVVIVRRPSETSTNAALSGRLTAIGA